jgi:hypothetical protein
MVPGPKYEYVWSEGVVLRRIETGTVHAYIKLVRVHG